MHRLLDGMGAIQQPEPHQENTRSFEYIYSDPLLKQYTLLRY
jgi:hypothetical protein